MALKMSEIQAIRDTQERIVRQAMLSSFTGIKDSAIISNIEQLISAGDYDAIMSVLGLDESALGDLSEAIDAAYKEGGKTTAGMIERVPSQLGTTPFFFDTRNDGATAWLGTYSSGLVTEMIGDQRNMIRYVLGVGLGIGRNPRESALDLVGRVDSTGKRQGGFIGLTTQQSKWIVNAQEELENLDPKYLERKLRDKRFDKVVQKAIDTDKPLTNKQIQRMITRMEGQALRFRAEMIARTESLTALRAGQHEAILQAISKGGMDEGDVKKVWDATGDSRTREQHLLLEGQEQPVNSPFKAPDGSQLQYPGDTSLGATAAMTIMCRCIARYEIDFIGRAIRLAGF